MEWGSLCRGPESRIGKLWGDSTGNSSVAQGQREVVETASQTPRRTDGRLPGPVTPGVVGEEETSLRQEDELRTHLTFSEIKQDESRDTD